MGADYLEPCWFRGELNGHASLYRAAALHGGGGNHAVQMKHAVLNIPLVAREVGELTRCCKMSNFFPCDFVALACNCRPAFVDGTGRWWPAEL